jgi:hypothetical protein
LELGRRLIIAMYSSRPDLSDLGARQLLQLVALAECYGVGKVVADAAGQLQKACVEAMPLDIAAAVFELPDACLELPAVEKVQQAAADKLQQELGDLEVVWGDKDKQQALLGLPLGALLQLLKDNRTQVASEDTAVYTAQRWLEAGQTPHSQQQQQQLAGVLRPQHCTATFIAMMATEAEWAWVADNSNSKLADLVAVAGRERYSTERQMWVEMLPEDMAEWRLPPRPASALSQLELSWDLPLKELEEKLFKAPDQVADLDSPSDAIWQGRRWSLAFLHKPGNETLQGFVCLEGAAAYVTGVLRLEPRVGLPRGRDTGRRSQQMQGVYVRSDAGGAVAIKGADKIADGPTLRAWLQWGLLHNDGCLHLRATINGVA